MRKKKFQSGGPHLQKELGTLDLFGVGIVGQCGVPETLALLIYQPSYMVYDLGAGESGFLHSHRMSERGAFFLLIL